jgi:hypothetical protein
MYFGFYVTDRDDVHLRQRRGIGSIDTNDRQILIHAPIEDVARSLGQVIQIAQLELDACGRQLEIQHHGLVILQFQGHAWTTIVAPWFNFSYYSYQLKSETAGLWSQILNTDAIYYQVSDTGSYIGYQLFNRGNSIETLFYTSSEDRKSEFESSLRQIEPEYFIYNAYRMVYNFMVERNIYIPSFRWNDACGANQHLLFQIKGLKCTDFVRIDYAVAISDTA